jgi:hypothetical protein
MGEDQQQALSSLRHEQSTLQGRVKGLEEQRRLFEKLGYSRYYLDMQLEALKGDLAVCEFRLRLVEKGIQASSRAARRQARAEAQPQAEVTTRNLLPVIGAFVVSILALSAAGLLWVQRFGEQTSAATPTPAAIVMVATSTPSPTPVLPTPTPVTSVFAVVKTDGLNVRKEAGSSGAVMVILTKGRVVQLAGDQVDADGVQWYRIADSGWIAGEHVQIFPTKEQAEEFSGSLD